MDELLRRLREKQDDEDLTLQEMAQRIGVTAACLCMIYRRQRSPGRKFLSGVLVAYPDLRECILRALRADVDKNGSRISTVGGEC